MWNDVRTSMWSDVVMYVYVKWCNMNVYVYVKWCTSMRLKCTSCTYVYVKMYLCEVMYVYVKSSMWSDVRLGTDVRIEVM